MKTLRSTDDKYDEIQRCIFRCLPIDLARHVELFLRPRIIPTVESLIKYVQVYPLCYASVWLSVIGKVRNKDGLWTVLEAETSIVLDVVLVFEEYHWDVVKTFLCSSSIEALTVEFKYVFPAQLMHLIENIHLSKNKEHIFVFYEIYDGVVRPEDPCDVFKAKDYKLIGDLLQRDSCIISLDITTTELYALSTPFLLDKTFVNAVNQSPKIYYLRLAMANIRTEGAVMLAQALTHHPTLEFVDISDNDLRDKGVRAFAEYLSVALHVKRALYFSSRRNR